MIHLRGLIFERVTPHYQKTRARVREAVSASLVIVFLLSCAWMSCGTLEAPARAEAQGPAISVLQVEDQRDSMRCVRIPKHELPVLLPEESYAAENRRIQGWYNELADSLISESWVEGDDCSERPYCCTDNEWYDYQKYCMMGIFIEPQPYEVDSGVVTLTAALFPHGDGTYHLPKQIRIRYDE